MIRKIVNTVLRRRDNASREVGRYAQGSLHARISETRLRDGTLEYWIDVLWDCEGQECTAHGLLRRSAPGLHVDVMRESLSYLRQLPR